MEDRVTSPERSLIFNDAISKLREELKTKDRELQNLKRAHEEFTHSSKELEDEMEAELDEADKAMKDLRESNGRLEGQIEALQSKLEAAAKELTKAEAQLETVKTSEETSKAQCRELEAKLDDTTEQERRASSELGMLRAQVERMEEEKIFAVMDLEELKQDAQTKEERQRQQINELREEVLALTPMKRSSLKGHHRRISNSTAESSSFDAAYGACFTTTAFNLEDAKLHGEDLREQLAAAFSRIKELEKEIESLTARGIRNKEELCSMSINGLHVSCTVM